MAISQTKNGGKQSFNAPFSASHLEKTRTSASDFASWSRTNEKPPVVRCGNSKRMQNRRASSPCPTRHPSRTLPTNEWRKFIRFRNEWRKLAHYSAGSLPQTYADPPFVFKRKKNRRSSRSAQTPGGQPPTGLEKHTVRHWPSQSARTPASRSPSGRVLNASPQMVDRSLNPPGASATRTPSPPEEAQDSK